jgi:hypothetical protein
MLAAVTPTGSHLSKTATMGSAAAKQSQVERFISPALPASGETPSQSCTVGWADPEARISSHTFSLYEARAVTQNLVPAMEVELFHAPRVQLC